jgi:hypothetical protein
MRACNGTQKLVVLWVRLEIFTFVEDFLDQVFSNVLVSRQEGILPGSWKLDSPFKKGSKGKLIILTGVFSFYLGIPERGNPLCGRGHPSLLCCSTTATCG